jgi:hypothetical protein
LNAGVPPRERFLCKIQADGGHLFLGLAARMKVQRENQVGPLWQTHRQVVGEFAGVAAERPAPEAVELRVVKQTEPRRTPGGRWQPAQF